MKDKINTRKERLGEIKKNIVEELSKEDNKILKDINDHYVGKDTTLLLLSYHKDLLIQKLAEARHIIELYEED